MGRAENKNTHHSEMGVNWVELLAGIRQRIEERLASLAEVADEMRDVRSSDTLPSKRLLYNLASRYEGLGDFQDTIFALYRTAERARHPDFDIPTSVAGELQEALACLSRASTILLFHAGELREAANSASSIRYAPRREMGAISEIQSSIESVEDVRLPAKRKDEQFGQTLH